MNISQQPVWLLHGLGLGSSLAPLRVFAVDRRGRVEEFLGIDTNLALAQNLGPLKPRARMSKKIGRDSLQAWCEDIGSNCRIRARYRTSAHLSSLSERPLWTDPVWSNEAAVPL